MHAIKNFAVLWCLYWLQVDDCICRSVGVSMKISLPSMIANVFGNFSLKNTRKSSSNLLDRRHPVQLLDMMIEETNPCSEVS